MNTTAKTAKASEKKTTVRAIRARYNAIIQAVNTLFGRKELRHWDVYVGEISPLDTYERKHLLTPEVRAEWRQIENGIGKLAAVVRVAEAKHRESIRLIQEARKKLLADLQEWRDVKCLQATVSVLTPDELAALRRVRIDEIESRLEACGVDPKEYRKAFSDRNPVYA